MQACNCGRDLMGRSPFVASGRREGVIDLPPGVAAKQECQARNLSSQPLQVRLVRIEPDSGEVEVLITFLLDAKRYPYAVFKELYHQRWPAEEDQSAGSTTGASSAHSGVRSELFKALLR